MPCALLYAAFSMENAVLPGHTQSYSTEAAWLIKI